MNFKDKDALYLQIADYVSEHISLGKWLPDHKIPSIRDLAIQFQVNPNTVTRAYDFLQQYDIVINKRGMGMFVTADAVERIKIIRQDRFMQQELPDFFTSLYLLDIDLNEVLQRYEDFKNNKTKTTDNENEQ
jgi:GntR family transcriptional regulator